MACENDESYSTNYYVYLIRENRFLMQRMPIYTIGSTSKTLDEFEDQQQFPYILIVFISVKNRHVALQKFMERFDVLFTKESNYGEGCYSGNEQDIRVAFGQIMRDVLLAEN